MGLAAGSLRELVSIEAESRVSNGQGGFTATWAEIDLVNANVVGMSGNEALRAGIERASTQYRVTIRKPSAVTAKNRLRWNGQVMSIHSSMPHPNYPTEAILLLCETGSAG